MSSLQQKTYLLILFVIETTGSFVTPLLTDHELIQFIAFLKSCNVNFYEYLITPRKYD